MVNNEAAGKQQSAAGSVITLQRACGIPLYYQIFALLRDNIIAGFIPMGTILPSEEDLALRYNVGRVTARRAVQELVGIHLVERRPRIGTRVIYDANVLQQGDDGDISNMLITLHGETVRMIDYNIIGPTARTALVMNLAPGVKVVRARRMRVFEGEPVALIESTVPEHYASIVSRDKLLRFHLHVLLGNAGLVDLQFRQSISSIAAHPDLAALLKVDARSPILCIERLICAPDAGPVALTVTHFRADRVRLDLDPDGNFGQLAPKLVR